jgi:tetratricopeptide (TPR) repeat protein
MLFYSETKLQINSIKMIFTSEMTAHQSLQSFFRKFTVRPEHKQLYDEGNDFYKAKQYYKAIDKLKDSLRALNYHKKGTKFTDKQIDDTVLPIFLKLAACTNELQEYQKTLFYCRIVLEFRPKHKKALYLQSVTNIQLGSFSSAMSFYGK